MDIKKSIVWHILCCEFGSRQKLFYEYACKVKYQSMHTVSAKLWFIAVGLSLAFPIFFGPLYCHEYYYQENMGKLTPWWMFSIYTTNEKF